MKLAMFVFIISQVAIASSAPSNPYSKLRPTLRADGVASHFEFLTDDEKSFRFELSFDNLTTDPQSNLVLVQVDSNFLIERYFGILNDNGMMGDQKAGDKVFSRKVQFKERKPRDLHFAVFYDDASTKTHRGDIIPESSRIPLKEPLVGKVSGRPNFLEVVSELWTKLTKK